MRLEMQAGVIVRRGEKVGDLIDRSYSKCCIWEAACCVNAVLWWGGVESE